MSIRRFVSFSSVTAFILLAATAASAQEQAVPAAKPHFGDQGQFALSLNHGLLVNAADLVSGDELQASFFVAPNFSLGLGLGIQWLSSSPPAGDSQHSVVFHAGPRLGYNFRISELVSFWPQAGVDYRRMDSSSTVTTVPSGTTGVPSTSQTTTTSSAFGVSVMAPVLIHPTRGFFLGAGPAFYADFSNSNSAGSQSTDNSKITSVGLVATIGGAF
jgi:hypothetical protein